MQLVHNRLQDPARELREPLLLMSNCPRQDLDMPETVRCVPLSVCLDSWESAAEQAFPIASSMLIGRAPRVFPKGIRPSPQATQKRFKRVSSIRVTAQLQTGAFLGTSPETTLCGVLQDNFVQDIGINDVTLRGSDAVQSLLIFGVSSILGLGALVDL
jgi:hypothetical protein